MNLLDFITSLFFTFSIKAEDQKFIDMLKPPVDISVDGHRIDYLFNFTTVLIAFFFILVCIGLFGFSYWYNKKRHPKPLYTHGTTRKQIAVVALLASMVFIMIDMQITAKSNHDYMEIFGKWPSETEDILRVEVLGQQWAWNFRYAGADGKFNTEDDVVSLNDLRLPTGKKIVFQVTSKDVIHSFFLPNARVKVDAMPGRISRMWTHLKTTGTYPVACAEMCGTYHYRMQAKYTVMNQADFDAWMKERQDQAQYVNDKENSDNYWGWNWIVANN